MFNYLVNKIQPAFMLNLQQILHMSISKMQFVPCQLSDNVVFSVM
jgi:hypothetical protein